MRVINGHEQDEQNHIWEEGEIGKKIRRIRNDKNFMAVRGQVN